MYLWCLVENGLGEMPGIPESGPVKDKGDIEFVVPGTPLLSFHVLLHS